MTVLVTSKKRSSILNGSARSAALLSHRPRSANPRDAKGVLSPGVFALVAATGARPQPRSPYGIARRAPVRAPVMEWRFRPAWRLCSPARDSQRTAPRPRPVVAGHRVAVPVCPPASDPQRCGASGAEQRTWSSWVAPSGAPANCGSKTRRRSASPHLFDEYAVAICGKANGPAVQRPGRPKWDACSWLAARRALPPVTRLRPPANLRIPLCLLSSVPSDYEDIPQKGARQRLSASDRRPSSSCRAGRAPLPAEPGARSVP